VAVTPSDSSPAPGPFSGSSPSYSIPVVDPSISITPASLPAATTAQAYSESFSANGGTAPYGYAVDSGTLPTGLTLSGGVLSGIPTASGNHNFTIEVSDAYGFTGSTAYTITVGDPTVAITGPSSGTLPDATGGTDYSGVTITATGGTSPHVFEVASGTLPAGMSLSAAGVLSGTPTAAGTSNFTVTAKDSSSAPGPFTSAPIAYSLTVAAPTVSFTPASLPAAATAQAYSQTFVASGGTAPYTYALASGTPPTGLS
ncbi:putative Ig domain-containing protein, partial [Rhizobiaceae sp. 2RAB30]